jgi:hypothetical protein
MSRAPMWQSRAEALTLAIWSCKSPARDMKHKYQDVLSHQLLSSKVVAEVIVALLYDLYSDKMSNTISPYTKIM